jgi:transposase-like protein
MNSTNVREGDSLPGPIRSEAIIQLRRGRALGDVAREYGLSVSDLCQWIAETASAFEALTIVPETEDDEVTRLRRENECLRKQRDFYRKAAGIVSVDVSPEKWRADKPR